ncbi:diaminopropionate ammonia-lyase [Dendrosporobacter sp. 1207_IL3150]|uniref:diaminopropionate ammonia-lyase n=1 Tax=Dendrosporobacter sp. 1207_IL3150 TaxID=3084054 RepID=UPI002FDA5AB4
MTEAIQWKTNTMIKNAKMGVSTALFSKNEIKKVQEFHKSFPQYNPTPLYTLPCLARRLGVAGIYIKDESKRFGLNAFKVLGGSYAMARYIAEKLQFDISDLPYDVLISPKIRELIGNLTFATTTDGNHGRGVAWTAKQLKQQANVYMPKGSSYERLQAIRNEGAIATITNFNYDDTVRLTAEQACKKGWVVVQDTAWGGYEDIPTWIMQGYGTLTAEAFEQLETFNVEKPSHIFMQAGVGSLAGSMQAYLTDLFKDERPKVTIVESNQADCFYQSVLAGDGKPRNVGGDMKTIMAGLACGEPNSIGWNFLRDYSEVFVSCSDSIAARGMRVLGNPNGNDQRIISGESGAVTLGLLYYLMTNKDSEKAKSALGLNADSTILLVSTEGNTDPEKYLDIVWDGKNN